MRQVELIVCDDSSGYETEVFVSIPDELHNSRSVDDVADWVVNNLDCITESAVYIGVYNWNDENEVLE